MQCKLSGTFPNPHQAQTRAAFRAWSKKGKHVVSGSRKTRLNRCTLVTMSRHAHVKRWEVRRVRRRRCRARLRGQSMLHGGRLPPQAGGPPYVFSGPASLLFDPLRHLSYPAAISCIVCRASASLIVSAWARISWAPYSPAADEQYKLSVWRNLAISAFGRCH